MKQKTTLLAVLLICIAILGSGTLAYYTSDYQVHNVITTDGVDIEIEEWQETDEGLVPYPDEKIQVMPGTEVSKIATVKNNEAEAFVRAKYVITVKDASEQVMNLSQETLDEIISVALNTDNWEQKDGDSEWWYYNKPVASATSTEAFFTKVIFDGPNMTNEYQNCTVEIEVIAQAVQKANNGESALTAAGWSAE